MITLIISILFCFTFYFIVKLKNTTYKYKTLFVLKNQMTPNWSGGTNDPFNLIGNIPGLMGDKVEIIEETKFVFGVEKSCRIYISQSHMDDYDDFGY